MELKLTKKEYNDIPVYYCTECLSLAIRENDGLDYCDDCGNTTIVVGHIKEWNKLINSRYKK